MYGTTSEVLSVRHPRASRRIPCAKCLSVRHVTNECKNAKYAAEGLARHTLAVEVTPPSLPPKLTAALSPKKLERQLHQLREHAAPDVGSRLREEEGERLATIEKKAKRRAEHAAREAAAEARAKKADKDQAAAALARSQLKISKAGLRAVTKQLKALQRRAQDAHEGVEAQVPLTESTHEPEDKLEHVTENKSAGEPENETGTDSGNDASTESDTESVTGTGNDAENELGSGQTDEPCNQTDHGTLIGTVNEQPEQPEQLAENKPTDTVCTVSANDDAPALSHGETAGSSLVPVPTEPHQQAVPAATDGNDDDADRVKASATGKRSNPPTPTSSDDEREMYSKSRRIRHPLDVDENTESSLVQVPSEPHQQEEPAVAEDIDDDAYRVTGSATGKRSSPPTPTSSHDEREMYSKAHRTIHPFDVDESSIDGDVHDYLSELLADIEASGKARQPVLALTGASTSDDAGSDKPPTAVATTDATSAAQLEQEMMERMTRPVSHWLSSFPSPALDDLLDSLRSPLAIVTWMQALHARMIETPGTGGCLYYALHVSRTRGHRQGKTITARTEKRFTNHTFEGNWYKARVCESFLEYLEHMLSDGTITLADLKRRLPTGATGLDSRDAAITAIKQFIKGIAATNVGKKLDRAQWGADEELFATVWFMREPVFIITEGKDRRTSVRVIWLDRPHTDSPERIVQLFPDAGEAYELIRVFLRHRFLPTVLIHVTVSSDGHFNSLRFEEKLYKEWTADDKSGEKMRGRMQHALLHLGWYAAPPTNAGITKANVLDLADSGSVYEPSQPELLDSTATPLSLDALLSPPAHYALLCSLNPRGRRRGVLADLWTLAENQNLQAYRRWDADQQQNDVRSEPDTLNGGCRHWSSQLSQLVLILRALPYPEVAMSLLPEDLIQRMGNELNNLASDGGVPDFIRAEDPVTARRHWVRLVALVVVASDDDLIELRSIDWLRSHPVETLAALHAVRLHDWTVLSKLTRPNPHAQPNHSADASLSSATRS